MKQLLLSVSLIAILTACTKPAEITVDPVPATILVKSHADKQLRLQMHRLLTDHIIWTRSYLVAAISKSGDGQEAAKRLLKNQDDLGNLFANYYGPEKGAALAKLLKTHILVAVEIIENIRNEEKSKFNDVNHRWQQNGYEIADFLTSLNPNFENRKMRDMWDKHLAATTVETIARFQKDWVADIRAFDETYDHMSMFADELTDDIIKQFPEKFVGTN